MTTRRTLLATAAGLALALTGLPAMAQDEYPTKPITMLVGYGAGGQTDLIARASAKVLADQLGQPVNVVNKPGAGGAVAANELRGMAPDGYTILFQSNAVINAAPFLMDRVDFKPDDFEYAGMITAYQTGLAAPKDAPYEDLTGFIAWARENPDFAYAALSAEARMYMDRIAEQEGLQANAVPVQSGSEMVNTLLAKQVAVAFSGGIHYRYPDEIKTIAPTTTFRHPSAPDVPTIEEAGFPLAMDTRTVIILPKGTPREILDRISSALKAAETDPEFVKVTETANIPIMYYDAAAAAKEMQETYDKNKVILTGGN
ncbi:Tripartite-type tricarboxylate transporter, receptor component TctC [Lutimaribacter pacificus]|uniref:Tripartite-type tricarboxylate transporter, receptor component TctC n=1 Tax=Lutimaribacter pacificus TaxID=391948 RepID=A0A1H0N7E1_9RHOB|nr:tripartite tricarboxylate transporter substrate binding protein [Lutimaribacter pacificus]SDO88602.1 Tripartite-type tricarboxylate transporter, receptor component TctC [Lutimaribacter pacificus]SHK86184.1 Tripartite-type tricarboxylate transporter, receptor component TctC [Lutimaribacter pacificus]